MYARWERQPQPQDNQVIPEMLIEVRTKDEVGAPWRPVANAFHEVLEPQTDDGPSRVFLERGEDFHDNPPDDDWDGICHMTTK